MSMRSPDLLKPLAAKYIWWLPPDEAIQSPRRVVAQVMELGDYDDVQDLAEAVGDAGLIDVIRHAEPGWFSARSWTYWHYRLGLAQPEQVPPLPTRAPA